MKTSARRFALIALMILIATPIALAAWAEIQFRRGADQAALDWRDQRPARLSALGSTRTLTVLPLIDWDASRSDLQREAGVSYLVKTDHNAILFDVGFNGVRTDPSPLQQNMRVLGVRLEDIDTVVISHNHLDHVGGLQWSRQGTFAIGNGQPNLSGKQVFTPVPMHYPGISTITSTAPTAIGEGVATTGTIPRELFVLGRVDEQALAVNVEGKGIVLIVGCGHQTIQKLLERTKQAFGLPLYGLIGGMHYPVPGGRERMLGVDVQRLFAGSGWLHPLNETDVYEDIEILKAKRPALVALSAHDSSDEVIAKFRAAFGTRYRYLRVGDPIVVQ
jgi:7,8-dihydropterin-6-yl-methyl-4-(beta-D-ribofuranosyl)aminobenzene 5'-phosphate synthase